MSASNGKGSHDVPLPHDAGAERALLGTVFRRPDLFTEISPLVGPADFHIHANALIYGLMAKLHGKGEPIDLVTVATAIGNANLTDEIGGLPYLATLNESAPVSCNFKSYAKAITDKSLTRGALRAGHRLVGLAGDPTLPPLELVDFMARTLDDLQRTDEGDEFGEPVVASKLRANENLTRWILRGIIPEKQIVLFSALWKAGKTTLLADFLRATADGSACCELEVTPSTVLYISEENEDRWHVRRNQVGIGDNVHFWCRPFKAKPNLATWRRFVDRVRKKVETIKADLVIFDSLTSLWSVRDENNAPEVQEALMPLWNVSPLAAIVFVHHLKKGDGQEGTGSRGSGALMSFVDSIIELRRYDGRDPNCRRRVLTGYGREDGIPSELVIEYMADGSGYRNLGTKRDSRMDAIRETLFGILPTERPGMDFDAIKAAWPDDEMPTKGVILQVLKDGVDAGDWQRDGTGRKGSPHLYVLPMAP